MTLKIDKVRNECEFRDVAQKCAGQTFATIKRGKEKHVEKSL